MSGRHVVERPRLVPSPKPNETALKLLGRLLPRIRRAAWGVKALGLTLDEMSMNRYEIQEGIKPMVHNQEMMDGIYSAIQALGEHMDGMLEGLDGMRD